MTKRRVKRVRRRCSECRQWYVPAQSAVKTQRTCSKKCRLRRRAKLERARRAADLANARADERERQRRHRAQKGAKKGADPPMSQAGLYVQMQDIIEEIMEDLGQAQRLSLTGLRRRLHRIALKTYEKIERDAMNSGT